MTMSCTTRARAECSTAEASESQFSGRLSSAIVSRLVTRAGLHHIASIFECVDAASWSEAFLRGSLVSARADPEAARRRAVLLVLDAGLLGGTLPASEGAAVPATLPFTGTVDDFYVVFYVVPDPLPPGEPADLIRVQAVSQNVTSTTVRIMYHSRDALLRDRAVTGMLTTRTRLLPAAGGPSSRGRTAP
jgi:hypothetical protein